MERLTLMATVAENNVIGANGQIPWNFDGVLIRFKRFTTGHPVIMGRKTYESFDDQNNILSDGENIVLSRNKNFVAGSGVHVCHSIDEALRTAEIYGHGQTFVIGGQQVFEQTIELADRLELTEIHQGYEGDSFFPPIDPMIWSLLVTTPFDMYRFATYIRKTC